MSKIRLKEHEIDIIKVTFKNYFMPNDHLWIFGSRTNLEKKGGDIDLYIETHYEDTDKIGNAKLEFIIELKKKLGDQKIDAVIKILNNTFELPIYEIAKNEGIKLL